MPNGQVPYTITEIAVIVNGRLLCAYDPDAIIEELLIDSRRLLSPGNSLFFALVSHHNDGHRYIPELIAKGIRHFIVSSLPDSLGDALTSGLINVIKVDGTLEALQRLCSCHRRRFSVPVIGITGSNGKTIVKEWLYQLMARDMNIVRSPQSYNSQIGVPLSVWQMNDLHELAIFEAGISQPGEMDRLREVIHPTIGLFTNIGQAHDENFSGTDQKIDEKLRLFYDATSLIYCHDHDQIRRHILNHPVLSKKETFTWGRDAGCDLRIESVQSSGLHTTLTAACRGDHLQVTIPFTDEASIENACHCWAVMLFFGCDNADIAARMKALSPLAMRMELKEAVNNCSVIDDSYISDIKSLRIALDFLEQQKQHPRKTVIISDILQSGKKDRELYGEVAGLLQLKNIDRVIGIGPGISGQKDLFAMSHAFYPDTEAFLNAFDPSSFDNEAILLKGARKFQFEKISSILQLKTHETVLEINLDALVHNLNYYRSRLQPATRVMAMVKAFSYGSGSFEIASTLQFHHTDYLAVAYADEGVELRQAGITMPIMVMNPEERAMETIIRHHLEPEVYNFRVLQLLDAAVRHFNGRNGPGPVAVHIKLETGMHRLGFEEEHLDELIARLHGHPNIRPVSVFSHLAASEDPVHDEFTRLQIERFRTMSECIQAAFGHHVLWHILNSAGAIRFPEAQFDMVRLGISLYGIAPGRDEQKYLRDVSTMKSSISQIKKVRVNESIGYNRQWIADREMTIAVVPVGYADGLSRRLSNGKGYLMVGGRQAPIVGNISMDMCTVDITGIPASEGDEVIVFGNGNPITNLAEALGTIPYEVLTSIPRRVKRVYYHE